MRLLWSEVRPATLAEVASRLREAAKPFRAVTMADLVAPQPSASTGLYFFLGVEHWQYVGRSASRALIERVPSHLDLRPEGWFGTLLKKLGERRRSAAAPSECVEEALDLRLALLIADESGVDLSTAEDAFRHGLQPALNTPRNVRPIDLHRVLLDDVS
jgi:hypothetical protein